MATSATGVVDPSATSATGIISNRSRRSRGPSLSQTWLSSKSDLFVFTRFGHFARECREEEDRCYKCHGNFLNRAHESQGDFLTTPPSPDF